MINEESKKQNQSWPHFLIDLDHAIEIGRKDASTEQTKIGTRPFMAIGVLRGEEHSFLHDLESFFWVLFWTCIHHGKSGKESRKSSYFDKWNYYNDLDLALAKESLLYSADQFIALSEREFMPYYKPLIPYVNELREMLPFIVELPGLIFEDSIRIKGPGPELYSQMINVLREAQKDPKVRAK
ncbi:hypothetical protein E4U31_007823 [Claviceps sp. LM219 group G6]|nr:hypothetical protein E4U31_007823 [Claviceps sp. LM219 group G6]